MEKSSSIKASPMVPSSGNRHLKVALALFILALAPVASAQVAILVNYDMQAYGARTNASTVHADVTATSLSGHLLNSQPGTLENPPGDFYTTWSPGMGGGDTAENAVLWDSYISFTIAPKAGKSITLESLSFSMYAATAGPSARQLYIFSDKTGFENGQELFTASTTTGSPLIPYNTSLGQTFSIDLSGSKAFADLRDSVTFRFYVQTPTEGQSLALSDITIHGSAEY